MEFFQQWLASLRQQYSWLSARQKTLAALLVTGMVMTVALYWRSNAEPDMTALLNQSLSGDEITQISGELDTRQIPYKISGDRVLVPSTRKIEVLGVLGYARHLPHDTNHAFDEIVKSIGVFDSPAVTDAKFIEAKQQTLQMIIDRFPGVDSAVVMIDPAGQRSLAGPDVPPTATVSMCTGNDVPTTNKRLAESAADMVCGAVGGLVRSGVKVVINGVNYPLQNATVDDGGSSDRIIDLHRQYETLYRDKIVNQLGFIHGLMVAVTVKLDLPATEKREHKIDPASAYGTPDSADAENADANDHLTGEAPRQGAGDAEVIAAAVRVPRSYLLAAYRSENDGKNPDPAALKDFTQSELDKIRADVKNCTGLASDEAITVGTYSDQTPVAAAATATPAAATPAGSILASHASQIGMGLLAIIGVIVVLALARKSTPARVVGGETSDDEVSEVDEETPAPSGPFAVLHSADNGKLLAFLRDEHPQTIAMVLAHLPRQKASEILVALPSDKQIEVVKRIGSLEQANPAVLREIEHGLEQRLGDVFGETFTATGEPMLGLEDLRLVRDQSIQAMLAEVDSEELSLALKTASEELKQKMYANMSARAAQHIEQAMQDLGPVRVRDVEAAQRRIIEAFQRVEDVGVQRMVA